MIERTYQASISETLEDAKKNVAEVETDATTEADTDQQSGLSGLFSKVKDSIGQRGQRHTGKIQADAERSHRGTGHSAGDLLPDSHSGDIAVPVAVQADYRH